MTGSSSTPYTGVENLEVLAGAVRYNRFLVESAIRARPGTKSLLDYGAGTGTLAAEWASQGIDVSCVEPDPSLRAALAARGLQVLENLDAAPDGRFDLVCAVNVLEHIEDDVPALASLGRKLGQDGRLFVWVPAFPLLFSSMDRKVGHHRRYTRSSLMRLADRSGLDVVSLRYADSLGFLVTLFYKWFGGSGGDLSPRTVQLYDRAIFPVSLLLDRIGGHAVLGKNLMAVLRGRR